MRSRDSQPFPVALEDDQQLVAACLAGHQDAWEALIRRFRRLIYSIAISFRFPEATADDVFQRVALKLLENLPKLRNTSSLASWIATVSRHECEAVWRDGRRISPATLDDLPEPAAPDAEPGEALITIEREHAMALAMERLGDPCRMLLHALYVEDPTPSYTDLAARLGRPVGALGPTRARCLKKLQDLYLASGGEPPH